MRWIDSLTTAFCDFPVLIGLLFRLHCSTMQVQLMPSVRLSVCRLSFAAWQWQGNVLVSYELNRVYWLSTI